MSDILKPKLRFKGFDSEWEKRKFYEIVDKYEDPVLTPHNGYTRLGIRSHAKGTFHESVKEGNELTTGQMHRVGAGNFIVNITFGWEHAVAITDEKDEGKLVSHRFPQYKFKDDLIPQFFKYIIVDDRFRHHLWLASPGGAGRNRVLKLDEMLEYSMVFPGKHEQQIITIFLNFLEKKIDYHKQKFEKLQNFKKSMLQKLFPQSSEKLPILRFFGFAETWEQRKLGEIVDVCSGRDYKYLSEGDIPVYGTGGYMLSVSEALSYDKDAIGIGRKGTIDKPYLLQAPFWTVDTLFYAIPMENVDLNFAFDIFQNVDWKKKDESTGVPSLSKSTINDIDILAPGCDEQQTVGQIFLKIDHLITLHQRQLEKLKNIKKSLLEKMFI